MLRKASPRREASEQQFDCSGRAPSAPSGQTISRWNMRVVDDFAFGGRRCPRCSQPGTRETRAGLLFACVSFAGCGHSIYVHLDAIRTRLLPADGAEAICSRRGCV